MAVVHLAQVVAADLSELVAASHQRKQPER